MDNDLKPMTVAGLLTLLANSIKAGDINKDDKIVLASDEEGNSFSRLCFRGIASGDNCLYLYPLFQNDEEVPA